MQDLRISLVQTSPKWEDIPANLELFNDLLVDLDPSDMVILPEMFNTGFTTQPEGVAETMKGPSLQWMKEKAFELNAAVCGSLIIKEEGNFYNRFIFMTPEGDYQHYDKRHLFSMGGEDKTFSKGKQRLVLNYKGWNILPMICYDLRFPAWSRNTWEDGKYAFDLMIYIASWPEVRNHAWKSLLPARAIENLTYVAAVSRIGIDGNNIAHSGDSMVIDYLGNTMLQLPDHQQAIQSVSLSQHQLAGFREKFNVGPDWDGLRIDD
jgi:predicted amidohydrolase